MIKTNPLVLEFAHDLELEGKPIIKKGTSGENVLYIYPKSGVIKDFLSRSNINDEIEIMSSLEGSKYYQMIDYKNEPALKLIAYEWVNPVLDNIAKLGTNINYLNRMIHDILDNIVYLAKINWIHDDTGLGNVGCKRNGKSYRFVLIDYEDAKKKNNPETLKELVLSDIIKFLEDIVHHLTKNNYLEHANYVLNLKDYLLTNLSKIETITTTNFRKQKLEIIVNVPTFTKFKEILQYFKIFSSQVA